MNDSWSKNEIYFSYLIAHIFFDITQPSHLILRRRFNPPDLVPVSKFMFEGYVC